MISFISSFEIVNVVTHKSEGLPDPNNFVLIVACVADATALNPNGIKTLLVNGLGMFPIKCIPVFSNCYKSIPKNPSDCPILCN